jgi:hypothetical protein
LHELKCGTSFWQEDIAQIQMLCWGWGTWKRSWQYFDLDIDKGIQTLSQLHHYIKLYNRIALSTLRTHKVNRSKTWAAHWHANVTKQKGCCLTSGVSLITNIGHDNSGTHCQPSDVFNADVAERQITIAPIALEENKKAVRAATNVLRKSIPAVSKRIGNKIKQIISSKNDSN